MQSYRFLEHTSDLFIEGRGASVGEAVASVAQGLFISISNSCKLGTLEKVVFDESGSDIEELIINIFTRVLGEMDATGKVGCNLEVLDFDEHNFRAKVRLFMCESDAKLNVKAATFHDYSLIRNDEVVLHVLFDI